MKVEVLILVFVASAFAKTSSSNIAAIAKPSVCSQTMDVFNKAGAYEKNLCYIRTKATYFQAQAFCQKSGMKLYQVQSSATAATKLQDYAKSVLNGNRNAFVFVEGINGTECLAYDGYGRKRYLLCSTPTFFVCQFYITGVMAPCPICTTSLMWPYTSSTGTTANCHCLKKGGGLYRIFLDGVPQKTCCSPVAPRCPNYSLTPITCNLPFHLLHPWIINNGYCCDIVTGFP